MQYSEIMHNPAADDLFFEPAAEPITEDDAFLADLVARADLPTLLAALAAGLRDPELVPAEVSPPLTPVDTAAHPHGGMTPAQQTAARALALDGLRRMRDTGTRRVAPLDDALADRILGFLAGGRTAWIPFLRHDLDLVDKRAAPDWRADALAPGRDHPILVVGAGVSGITAAYRSLQTGLPVTIIEAADDLGGTWLKNDYPGVRLDTATFGYAYSFAQKPDWAHQYATGPEVQAYLRDVAARAGIAARIEVSTRLVRAVWDEATHRWRVTTEAPDGVREREFGAVFAALGQLDVPSIPDFPGRGDYRGDQMHSQEWDHGIRLAGRRVAVIGTGASAYQIAPAIVDEVAELRVFQRSAPWMLPAPNYHEPVTDAFAWLVRKVPHYGQWFRLWTIVLGTEGRFHTTRVDPDWPGIPASVSATNARVRDDLIARMRAQYTTRPELLEAAIPDYPPGAKRMLRDNGVWAAAMQHERTRLVTSPIERFEATGIRTADGEHHEVDVVVYATGFKPADFLEGVEIVGRGGVELHEFWGGDARAHNGVAVPGFPGFFILYGPNINGVVGGTLHFMLERSIEYSLKVVRATLAGGHRALDVTRAALDRFVARVDAENRAHAWGQPWVRTWYQNRFGRVTSIWPFSNQDYFEATEAVDLDDYETID